MSTADQTRCYFQQNVQPVFEELIAKIVFSRPENIQQFAIKYLENPTKINKEDSDSQQESDRFEEISQEQFDRRKAQKRQKAVRKKRKGVSSQASQVFTAQRKPISMRSVGLKDQKTQVMLRFYFMNSFLFQDFEEEEKNFLISSMLVNKTVEDEMIIRQGQLGDSMFFVESGFFQCSIAERDPKSTRKQFRVLRNYQAGDSFGQLCLLHNAKRQATVISKTEGLLYSLKREVFSHAKKMSIVKKRQLYIKNLKKVNIFSFLSKQDFEKICDLLTQVRVEPNQYVIHQGDMGTKFYIVIQGLMSSKSSSEETFHQYYKEGDYFGQLALITKKPRQVSVLAVTKCRLVSLSSRVFLNLINQDRAQEEITNKYKGAKPLMTMHRRRRQINSEMDSQC